jgi:plasmid maintenance system antidote protein VapI
MKSCKGNAPSRLIQLFVPVHFFGVDPQSWINLQTHYDTEQAREKLGDRLTRIMRNGAENGAIASLR